jgi:energy-converting hydrogenase Eha subunit E
MVSPFDDVYKPVVLKSGAAVALTTFVDNGAIITMVAMRAATRDRGPRLFNI